MKILPQINPNATSKTYGGGKTNKQNRSQGGEKATSTGLTARLMQRAQEKVAEVTQKYVKGILQLTLPTNRDAANEFSKGLVKLNESFKAAGRELNTIEFNQFQIVQKFFGIANHDQIKVNGDFVQQARARAGLVYLKLVNIKLDQANLDNLENVFKYMQSHANPMAAKQVMEDGDELWVSIRSSFINGNADTKSSIINAFKEIQFPIANSTRNSINAYDYFTRLSSEKLGGSRFSAVSNKHPSHNQFSNNIRPYNNINRFNDNSGINHVPASLNFKRPGAKDTHNENSSSIATSSKHGLGVQTMAQNERERIKMSPSNLIEFSEYLIYSLEAYLHHRNKGESLPVPKHLDGLIRYVFDIAPSKSDPSNSKPIASNYLNAKINMHKKMHKQILQEAQTGVILMKVRNSPGEVLMRYAKRANVYMQWVRADPFKNFTANANPRSEPKTPRFSFIEDGQNDTQVIKKQ
jgi:hypothetical protein